MADVVNDENARPQIGPNDSDRARFGFAKHCSHTERRTSVRCASPDAKAGATHPTPASQRQRDDKDREPEEEAVPDRVELVAQVGQILGRAEDSQLRELLRTRPTAAKYNFKARIAELEAQNRSLRSALMEQREKHKTLLETLAVAECDVNWRLRSSAAVGEATAAAQRQRREEHGDMVEVIRAAVLAAYQDHDGLPSASPGMAPSEGEAAAQRRAELAEAALALREKDLEGLRRENQDLYGELNHCKARRSAAEERFLQASSLVEGAGRLLEHQAEESQHQHDLLIAKLAEATTTLLTTQAQRAQGAPAQSERGPKSPIVRRMAAAAQSEHSCAATPKE